MSSASEFEVNLNLLNQALVKLKPYYNSQHPKSKTLDVVVELQALAVYVEKGSANQPRIPPKNDDFDEQVWKFFKQIENTATGTDIAQSQFNELFTQHQTDILNLAEINA